MKKHLVLILALLTLLCSCAIVVSAHSGGTDENGGHYDYSTGEYHYHHGYSAHEHVDGECPYNYEDNTSHTNSKKNNKDGTPIWAYILLGSVLALFIIPGTVTYVREVIRDIKEKPIRDKRIELAVIIFFILFGVVAPIVIKILIAVS